MLAVARRGPMPHDAIVEFKWDGVRALVETTPTSTVVRSRRGLELTATFPELDSIHHVTGPGVLLDGEIVALTDQHVPSFGLLQRRLGLTTPVRVHQARAEVPASLIAFDVLAVDGVLVIDEPLASRRARLEQLPLPDVVQVAPVGDDLDAVLAVAADRGLEGCVIKDATSTYEPGIRSNAWQKVRLVRRQEFVVGGWKPGAGAAAGRPGSLLLGVNDDDGLRYVGAVGSGFTDRAVDEWAQRVEATSSGQSPFVDEVPGDEVRWVQPVHVVDVQFREWTRDGRLRQPSYKGLRIDVDPAHVRREPDDH